MIEILDLNQAANRSLYTHLITCLDSKKPYNCLSFMESFSDGFAQLVCVKYEKEGTVVLLPGYLKTLGGDNNYKSFVSPYGYSGLIYNSYLQEEEIVQAWKAIKAYFDAHVISSFIRFSLDTNYTAFKEEITPKMKNIRGKILDYDHQWISFDRKVRKNVKRAKREQLTYKIVSGKELTDHQLESFYTIYKATMQRNQAMEKYYYSLGKIRTFVQTRGDLCAFCFVYDKEKAVSTEMVLLGDKELYSFLGGTLEEAFQKRANDFLKYQLINWAREQSFKHFVLGGGYGTQDGIYKYKKSFFPNDVVDYCTGQFIHNASIYQKLSDRAKKRFLKNRDKTEEDFKNLNFFPLFMAV